MTKRWLLVIIFLLTVPATFAYVIADYPTMFFSKGTFTATVVQSPAGSSAERLANNIVLNDLQRVASRKGLKPSIVTTAITGGTENEIIIGTTCGNMRIRELLNIRNGKCQTALKNGLLAIIQDENVHFLVTGPDAESVLDAAKVLTDERQRKQLKVPIARVVRKPYQKYYVLGGKRFLDIGETIGAETPTLYTGYPRVTYYR